MNPNTKTLLMRSAAVLGLVVVAGGAYLLTSTNTGFQADLLAQAPAETLPLVNANQNAVSNSNANAAGAQAVSSIFDATPTADITAAAVVIGSGNTMTGSVMSGTIMPSPLDDVTALQNLRPAAAQQADNLLGVLGLAANTNTNAPIQVANAVTTTNTETLPTATAAVSNTNATTTNANSNAATAALATLPRVPQTGAETWLLTASIVCAMMGMTLLLSAPKHV